MWRDGKRFREMRCGSRAGGAVRAVGCWMPKGGLSRVVWNEGEDGGAMEGQTEGLQSERKETLNGSGGEVQRGGRGERGRHNDTGRVGRLQRQRGGEES